MRLIDIDALIEEHCEGCNEDVREGCKTDPVCATLMWFEDAPTIDAELVTHQKWESRVVMGAEVWECSGCKTMGSPQWKRCPVCEAKMDGEVDET